MRRRLAGGRGARRESTEGRGVRMGSTGGRGARRGSTGGRGVRKGYPIPLLTIEDREVRRKMGFLNFKWLN